jgi:hypothetical protein
MHFKALATASLAVLTACGIAPNAPAPSHAELEKKAAGMSDAEIQRRVEALFVDSDPRRENFRTLSDADDRIIPYLIKALQDPRTQTMRFPRKQFDILDVSPFDRICGLLTSKPSPLAAKPLAAFLQHPDIEFRSEAASTLGRIASPDCIEPVKQALADRERRVRQSALLGIEAGIRENGRHQEFLNGVYDSVAALINDGTYNLDGPAIVMAKIDGAKAAPVLESRKYFNTRNPQLADVLDGLNFEGHKTPLAILMPLMKELAPAAGGNSGRAREFAAALKLYARNPDSEAEATFRSLAESGTDTVAVGAASALEILAGVNTRQVMDLGHNGKFAAMTNRQRYYYAVSEYHYEVCNGGHDQFFNNSSGDLYPTVLEGLHAIGAHEKATALQEAISGFGERVETDRRLRQLQMEHLPAAGDAHFKTADQMYFDSERRSGERVEVRLSLYAVTYASDFR